MRDTFVRALLEIARTDNNVVLMTADLGFGVLRPFWEELPDQFFNVGIAEQNMTSMAAGMAFEGKTVFTYSIGNFPTLRCLEQIRNDCAYHGANVKIVCVGGGFVYGPLGMSHHATEDLAVMRALPDVTVYAPGDPAEVEAIVPQMYRTAGTCYLRLGRGGEKRIHHVIPDMTGGRGLCISEGSEVAILSAGGILQEAEAAEVILSGKGIDTALYSFPVVKPIDRKTIEKLAGFCRIIVSVEEHNIVGGFGGAVAEVMAECGAAARLVRVGLDDTYASAVGSQRYLRKTYGLTGEAIANRVMEMLQ